MTNDAPETGTVIRAPDAPAVAGRPRHARRTGGEPYVSLAMVALDHDAAPLLYLSDLADHTRNLKARSTRLAAVRRHARQRGAARRRAGHGAGPDRARRPTSGMLARYVARHPDAAAYAGFRDFNLYRVTVERAHLVAGFGRIHWVAAERSRLAASGCRRPWQEAEAGIVAHMNDDHARRGPALRQPAPGALRR